MISVIIPFYNRPALLLEALQSLEEQTFRDWECILVNDGSTDSSAAIAREWLDGRQGRLIELPHSGMAGLARNRGASESRGDWIAFLDSDDLWKPEKLERQIRRAEEAPEIRLWHCREIWDREGRRVSQKGQRHRREGDIFTDALNKCIIGPSTVLIRRDLWEETGGFREDLEIAEDYELWLRMTCRESVGYLEEPLTVKRAGKWDQLSEKYGQIEIFRIEGLKALVEKGWFPIHGDDERQQTAEEELRRKCRIYAQGCRKRGRLEEARKYESLT